MWYVRPMSYNWFADWKTKHSVKRLNKLQFYKILILDLVKIGSYQNPDHIFTRLCNRTASSSEDIKCTMNLNITLFNKRYCKHNAIQAMAGTHSNKNKTDQNPPAGNCTPAFLIFFKFCLWSIVFIWTKFGLNAFVSVFKMRT